MDQLAVKRLRLKIQVYTVIFLIKFRTLWKKPRRNRCIIDWVIHLRNVKSVAEAAPLLHFFLTVLHFYTRNACSFTRVVYVIYLYWANYIFSYIVFGWQWIVRHIDMRYWGSTDALVMPLLRRHPNFCHDILIVSWKTWAIVWDIATVVTGVFVWGMALSHCTTHPGEHWTSAQCCHRDDSPPTTSAQHLPGMGRSLFFLVWSGSRFCARLFTTTVQEVTLALIWCHTITSICFMTFSSSANDIYTHCLLSVFTPWLRKHHSLSFLFFQAKPCITIPYCFNWTIKICLNQNSLDCLATQQTCFNE